MKPPTLEDAIRLARQVHAGQHDRYGVDYLEHPLRVMRRVTGQQDRIVAVLHDVVEDSDTTLDDLRRAGFSASTVRAVDALTRREGETYERYIERCAANATARRVKLADLEDNMDLRRFPRVTVNDLERLNRYLAAWRRLAPRTRRRENARSRRGRRWVVS